MQSITHLVLNTIDTNSQTTLYHIKMYISGITITSEILHNNNGVSVTWLTSTILSCKILYSTIVCLILLHSLDCKNVNETLQSGSPFQVESRCIITALFSENAKSTINLPCMTWKIFRLCHTFCHYVCLGGVGLQQR